MKKILMISIPLCVLLILLILLVVFKPFNKNEDTIATSSSIQESSKNLSAEDVVVKLKEKNNNIGTYVVYNENNDRNQLLGRPNQYTSKVTFEDIRLEQTNKNLEQEESAEDGINEPIGGTIEVFNNTEDMNNRKEYINAISSSMSFLAEYCYSNNYILLRLDKQLTPSQAQEYENIFNEIFN